MKKYFTKLYAHQLKLVCVCEETILILFKLCAWLYNKWLYITSHYPQYKFSQRHWKWLHPKICFFVLCRGSHQDGDDDSLWGFWELCTFFLKWFVTPALLYILFTKKGREIFSTEILPIMIKKRNVYIFYLKTNVYDNLTNDVFSSVLLPSLFAILRWARRD